MGLGWGWKVPGKKEKPHKTGQKPAFFPEGPQGPQNVQRTLHKPTSMGEALGVSESHKSTKNSPTDEVRKKKVFPVTGRAQKKSVA